MDAAMTPDQLAALPLPAWPRVHLCVRDEHGNIDGLCAVEVYDASNEIVIRVAAPDLAETVGGVEIYITPAPGYDWLRVGCEGPYEYALIDRRAHVGNICWDAATMGRRSVLRLLTQLLELGFHVEEVALP
jgi:hypothetical protein